VLGVIPARYDSERLPGKVLLPICGKPMVQVVYERARLSPLLDELYVATDSEKVRECCMVGAIPAIMTSPKHRNGTERILEVIESLQADVYVNIQADEPMITAEHLRLLIEPHISHSSDSPHSANSSPPEPLGHLQVHVTTLKTPLDAAEAGNPNVVKVVTDPRGGAIYFSRAPIPYPRNPASGVSFYKHLGLYAYTRAALERFRSLPVSPLEETERLEQLRFLENDIPIYVAETAADTIGVDTREDWEAVTRYFEALAGWG
jgi:3-deoxy-manno-octulosonate cytidylyltransferase (CMP-KDO synthetase)